MVDQADIASDLTPAWFIKRAPALCNRNTGIGADGIILLDHQQSPVLMHVINADGSLGYNCGNGLRCAIKYLHHKTSDQAFFLSLMGKTYQGHISNDFVQVSLGTCTLERLEDIFLDSANTNACIARADIGNQHLIISTQKAIDVALVLKEITSRFKTAPFNIGFVYPDANGELQSVVFERGVGFTKSCGSGAAAAACFVTFLGENGHGDSLRMSQPGGLLNITLQEVHKTETMGTYLVHQSGKALPVYTGIFECHDS